jgi:hypothetical protein
LYCFMNTPGKRLELKGIREGQIKSFWFKTFSHNSFTEIHTLLYKLENTKYIKTINKNFILEYVSARSLTYWIMCDGSLDNNKKIMILHTQNYDLVENTIISNELNLKFGFNTSVIKHKKLYYVIKFPNIDSNLLNSLISNYMHESMKYKLPKN